MKITTIHLDLFFVFFSMTPKSKKQRLRISPSSDEKKMSARMTDDLLTQLDLQYQFSEFIGDDNDQTSKNETTTNKTTKCNCKKSKCLKLYCECFAKEEYCGSNCSCTDCSNNAENIICIERSKKIIKERNPHAFKQKIIHGNRHSRGCKCKTSKCLKKYCECYQSGVQCTEYCLCEDCHNGKNGVHTTTVQNTENIIDDFTKGLGVY